MRLAEKILTPFGRVFKIDKFFCMVLQPIMHALKGQQRLALSLQMKAAKRS